MGRGAIDPRRLQRAAAIAAARRGVDRQRRGRAGADGGERRPSVGGVALELAVANGQIDIVHVLVEDGVDVNNTYGATTALVAAVDTRNVALMSYLEDHGAREKP